MKKIYLLFLLLAFLLSTFILTACGEKPQETTPDASTPTLTTPNDTTPNVTTPNVTTPNVTTPLVTTEPLKEITGVSFEDLTVSYDGTEKMITVSGLPTDVSVSYTDNRATDAGTYLASAHLSGDGYQSKTLTATLTIEKATISGITLAEDEKVTEDGEYHFPTLCGELPHGATASWYFNGVASSVGVKDPGNYAVRLVISGKNHHELVLEVNFKIKQDLLGIASDVIDAFGNVPDPWSFLPDSFSMESYTLSSDQLPSYTDFTSVSALPKKYIGKQLNVVLGLLNKCDTALSYVNTIHGALNIIETAYQNFLNTSPDNYAEFSDNAGAFTYTIIISDTNYYLKTKLGTVSITLFSEKTSGEYGARIQLTETTVLKYQVTASGLKIALSILNSAATQIEFVRSSEDTSLVTGYIYEYLTVAGKELVATSALLSVSADYTTVVGTKGDFIPTSDSRNCEVYENKTGSLVGSEVKETLGDGKKTYDTLWFNLRDITGITSIKKEDKANGVNPDTIYINGKSDSIHSMFVNGIFDTSRRFDIEFKKVIAYTYDSATDEYHEVEFEIPMMFVQEGNLETFEADYKSKNDVTVALSVSTKDNAAVHAGYHVLVDAYDLIRELVTQEKIIAFCAN